MHKVIWPQPAPIGTAGGSADTFVLKALLGNFGSRIQSCCETFLDKIIDLVL